jgi:hypothetical protein
MKLQYNDGGRLNAGYKGTTRDCVVRAIAIATGKQYQEVYDAINLLSKDERIGKRKHNRSNARLGVYKQTIRKYMESIGWQWTPTMFIGSGCKVHLKDGELPVGNLVVALSKHYAAVINGVINDTHDCSRNETRCVYGYYQRT